MGGLRAVQACVARAIYALSGLVYRVICALGGLCAGRSVRGAFLCGAVCAPCGLRRWSECSEHGEPLLVGGALGLLLPEEGGEYGELPGRHVDEA